MLGNLVEYSDPVTGTFPMVGGPARVVLVDPASRKCTNMNKTWTDHCDSAHPFCKNEEHSAEGETIFNPHPRLLIRVGTGPEDIHLEETRQRHLKYAALSYCWGRTGGLKLERSNVQDLKRRLPWSQLVKVHQDSIHVSHNLGI